MLKVLDNAGADNEATQDERGAPHGYLLPECENPESERAVLEHCWPQLFAAMLGCWLTDENQWPQDRTYGVFREWFDVQMCSSVEDLHRDEELIELDELATTCEGIWIGGGLIFG